MATPVLESEKHEDTIAHVMSIDDKGVPPSNVNNDVWGELSEDGPNYRNLGWKGSCILMIKYQIGLGVLGIVSTGRTRRTRTEPV